MEWTSSSDVPAKCLLGFVSEGLDLNDDLLIASAQSTQQQQQQQNSGPETSSTGKMMAIQPPPGAASLRQDDDEMTEERPPSPFNILCGRGIGNFNSPGNRRFKEIISEYVDTYQQAPSKVEKTEVVQKVLKTIKINGGRFIKQSDVDGREWYEISDREALEKTAHKLRDYISAQEMKSTAPNNSRHSSPPPPSSTGDELNDQSYLAPNRYDIVFGKGVAHRDLPGNRRLRGIIAKYCQRYNESRKGLKAEIVQEIIRRVKDVQETDRYGTSHVYEARFLIGNEDGMGYRLADTKTVHEKVRRTMSDYASKHLKKSSTKDVTKKSHDDDDGHGHAGSKTHSASSNDAKVPPTKQGSTHMQLEHVDEKHSFEGTKHTGSKDKNKRLAVVVKKPNRVANRNSTLSAGTKSITTTINTTTPDDNDDDDVESQSKNIFFIHNENNQVAVPEEEEKKAKRQYQGHRVCHDIDNSDDYDDDDDSTKDDAVSNTTRIVVREIFIIPLMDCTRTQRFVVVLTTLLFNSFALFLVVKTVQDPHILQTQNS